jgi:hypothetical protein
MSDEEGADERDGSLGGQTLGAGLPSVSGDEAGVSDVSELTDGQPDYIMRSGGATHISLKSVAERNRYILSPESDQTITNEIEARQKLITPLLHALGWNIYAPEVRAEARPTGMNERVDYALHDREGEVAVVVEAKRPGRVNSSADQQVKKYLRLSGAKYGLLTDGKEIRLWKVVNRTPPEETLLVNRTLWSLADERETGASLREDNIESITRYAIRGMNADLREWTARAVAEAQHETDDGDGKTTDPGEW